MHLLLEKILDPPLFKQESMYGLSAKNLAVKEKWSLVKV